MLPLLLLLVGRGDTQVPPPKPPSTAPKLEITDLQVGAGDAVVRGDIVSVDYTGKLADGKVFDTSKKAGGKPYSLMVGVGEVIKGWDQGLVGMKAGGVRKLVIPPDLAYGPRGKPPTIPPSATLTFTVAVNKVDHAIKRIKVEITRAGVGPGLDWDQDATVTMVWKGADKAVFVNTATKFPDGVPVKLGTRILPGFTLGVLGMKAGEKRVFVVPPDLAFGAAGQPDLKVKPNEPITMEVELLRIGSPPNTSGGREGRR